MFFFARSLLMGEKKGRQLCQRLRTREKNLQVRT